MILALYVTVNYMWRQISWYKITEENLFIVAVVVEVMKWRKCNVYHTVRIKSYDCAGTFLS